MRDKLWNTFLLETVGTLKPGSAGYIEPFWMVANERNECFLFSYAAIQSRKTDKHTLKVFRQPDGTYGVDIADCMNFRWLKFAEFQDPTVEVSVIQHGGEPLPIVRDRHASVRLA